MEFSSDNLQQRVTIVSTCDGSQTLSVDDGVEHYHSVNGAVAEAMHVYINAGLKSIEKSEINVFEVGFGTGLNAMLAYRYAVEYKKTIRYTAIEKYPLPADIIEKLTYPEQAEVDRGKFYALLHSASWNMSVDVDSRFILTKIEGDMVGYTPNPMIDVVFFDAFAPDLQPDLWSVEVFRKLYDAMGKGGVLVTYSSKGFVKRNLREVGFEVKRLAGPQGKRHMILAEK